MASYYLEILPPELQMYLARYYVNTVDVLNIIEAVPSLGYFLKEKRIFEKLWYYQAYGLRIIDTRIQTNFVTSINISCVYWLKASYLRQTLINFKNLTALYAVDTKLGFSKSDCWLYSKLKKLSTIAVTINSRNQKGFFFHHLKRIKNLYVHVDLEAHHKQLINLMLKIPNLEDVWIIDTWNVDKNTPVAINYRAIRRFTFLYVHRLYCSIPPSVKQCTLKFRPMPMSVPLPAIFAKQFKIVYKSNGYHRYEKRAVSATTEADHDNAPNIWQTIFQQHVFPRSNFWVPFGTNDLKKLAATSCKIDKSWKLEEVNFKLSDYCKCQMVSFVSTELIAKNLCRLQKLSVPSCFCDQLHEYRLEDGYWPEKRRVEDHISKLDQIVESSRWIETLEIWRCNNAVQSGRRSLDGICQLKNLKHLTLVNLDIQAYEPALMVICEKCPQLLRLKVKNSILPSYWDSTINSCNELRDLRLETDESMRISEVLQAFVNRTVNKIERIAISCKILLMPQCLDTFRQFFLSTPKLKFLYINAANLTESDCDSIVNVAREVYPENAEQIFVVTSLSNPNELDIPLIHKRDMILFETTVGVVDIFNGFIE